MLVYAGMPQFGARNRLSDQEKIWRSLLEQFARETPAFNVGGGTGYSIRGNRLVIASDMVRYRTNRDFYTSQQNVLFLPRDPLSWHFLDMLGLDPTLLLCPSGYNPPVQAEPAYEIAINVMPPDHEVFADDLADRREDYVDLVRSVVSRYPDALFICHEETDILFIRSLGGAHVVIPGSAPELVEAYSKARKVVSFRVHGTVAALLCRSQVLHFSIDGRSDLLTPYMAGGLWKYDLLRHDRAYHTSLLETFLGEDTVVDVAPIVTGQRDMALDRIEARFGKNPANSSDAPVRTLIVDPDKVGTLARDDEIILTHRRFHHRGEDYGDHSLIFAIAKTEGHAVYGPYITVPEGRYRLIFDCEFLGRFDGNLPVDLVYDVVDDASAFRESTRVPLRDALIQKRIAMLEFTTDRANASLEFRIYIDGHMPDLEMQFYGVRLRKLD